MYILYIYMYMYMYMYMSMCMCMCMRSALHSALFNLFGLQLSESIVVLQSPKVPLAFGYSSILNWPKSKAF